MYSAHLYGICDTESRFFNHSNRYAVGGDESEWEHIEQKIGQTLVGDSDKKSMTVSLANPNSSKKLLKRKVEEAQPIKSGKDRKKKTKKHK